MADIDLLSFLLSQVWNLPLVVIYFAGIILSLVFWQRHPRISALCLIAFVILLGSLLVGSGLQFWIVGTHGRGSSPEVIGRVVGSVGAFRVVLETIAWALLLAALFGWRSASASDGESG